MAHLDKTIVALDEKIENFKRSFGYYQDLMLQNQEKVFMGFKQSLIQGIREFKEVYEDEKNIDGGIELMSKLKADITQLDNEASEVIAKFNEDDKWKNQARRRGFSTLATRIWWLGFCLCFCSCLRAFCLKVP